MKTENYNPIIAYYRVSTRKQVDGLDAEGRETGLGLEAQRNAVHRFSEATAGEILREFQDVESGKRKDRPELMKAIALAKKMGARLVIAKLDRLARNVAFTSTLLETGVDFVACDNPNANKLTIHILAAVAEEEAAAISRRTTAAHAVYKARGGVSRRVRALYPNGVPEDVMAKYGGKLGAAHPDCPKFTEDQLAKGRELGVLTLKAEARERWSDVEPEIRSLRDQGKTYLEIAENLNASGYRTARTKKAPRGALFAPETVRRVLMKYSVSAAS
jgi:DNA invertase Pin-like site-specific DNA recombinase